MTDYSKFYNELNGLQRSAVDMIDGPVLVIAGPGTGKTQLLSVRAASILARKKAQAENILILTYTNSAAKSMKERLVKIAGPAGYDIEVGTFHSFANSIIQESEEAVNYVKDRILLDDVERTRAIEYVLDNAKGVEEIRPFGSPYTYLREILQKMSELKKDGITPDTLDNYLNEKGAQYRDMDQKYVGRLLAFSKVYRMYETLKEGGKAGGIFDERGRYDYDDMILFATSALENERALRDEYRARSKYVMVDEYQDTNEAQLSLLFAFLDPKAANLCCVGDDDQSIYRFQGASIGNFNLLQEKFPGIKVLRLKENYRSAKELIEASSRIIKLIPREERTGDKALAGLREWPDKEISFHEFTTGEEEFIYIVKKVGELKSRIESDTALSKDERSHPYNNIAVLVRKRSDILKVLGAFLSAGIPYATDGKEDISGERRVKQALDILELAHIDPGQARIKDLALYKVLSSDYMEIPHSDILKFINYVNRLRSKEGEGITLLGEFLDYFSSEKGDIAFQDAPKLHRAHSAVKHLLEDAQTRPVHKMMMDFINEAGLFRYILKEYASEDILRIRDLRALSSFVNMIKASDVAKPGLRLDDLMAEMKVRKDHGLPIQGNLVTLTQAGVRIYTAHGSKGLEFHSVIIPFCLQNKNWPIRAMPEKIRLPSDIFKTKEKTEDKDALRQLALYDETRLFYVAVTRAKANLIFTASPGEDAVASSYLDSLQLPRGRPVDPDEERLISDSLKRTDLKDPFIGTDEVLKDMLDNFSLNPTRLNTYIYCRRRFLYNDVLKLPGTKKRSLVFGNCVHKALEETYRTYKEAGKFPSFRFFRDAFSKELKFQGADDSMARECANKFETLRRWFETVSKNPVAPISLERKLIVTMGDNIIFTGKYDKTEWEDKAKGLIRIVDYKTGKPDGHIKALEHSKDLASDDCEGYLRQLVAYKLLFERDKSESRGRRVASGALVFVEPASSDMRRLGYKKGDYVNKVLNISDDMVASLEDLIKAVWNQIRELHFEKLPARVEDKCGRCDFDDICWGK